MYTEREKERKRQRERVRELERGVERGERYKIDRQRWKEREIQKEGRDIEQTDRD